MNLAYTICMDEPGAGGHRLMAKMLAMSLIRSHFDGVLLIFRSEGPELFQLPRPGMQEIPLPWLPPQPGRSTAEEAWTWKYRVAGAVREKAEEIRADKILYLDSDVLCLRNPDHLLEGDWDLGVTRERGRSFGERFFSGYLNPEELKELGGRTPVNAGTVAVRRECYPDVMAEWARIHAGSVPAGTPPPCDQCALNRLVLDTRLRTRSLEPGAVLFPLSHDFDYRRYRGATFVHCLGDTIEVKVRFMFGLYIGTYFFDEGGALLHLLDM